MSACLFRSLGFFQTTAKDCGWTAVSNGDLLNLAVKSFDAFITSDQNLRYQQNLSGRKITILELSTNNLRRLEAAAALMREALQVIKPGEFKRLDIP